MLDVKSLSYSDLKKANKEYERRYRMRCKNIRKGQARSGKHVGRKPILDQDTKDAIYLYHHNVYGYSLRQICEFYDAKYNRVYYWINRDEKRGALNE